MTDDFVEKTILDRNGIPKIIRVKVAGGQGIVTKPKWRGLEFGWNANDVTPEDESSSYRQIMQEWVIEHGGEVLARHVKIGRKYIPVVYSKNGDIFFITIGDTVNINYESWMKLADLSATNVFEQNVHFNKNVKKHSFKRLSQPIASIGT